VERKRIRLVLQILALISLFALAGTTQGGGSNSCCCSCGCFGGSDTVVCPNTSVAISNTAIERWHDYAFNSSPVTYNNKDWPYIKEWATKFSVGLLVPKAPGADQPGKLVGDGHHVQVNLQDRRGTAHDIRTRIPLVADPVAAQKLESMFPSGSDAHWQALKPANDDFLDMLPDDTTTWDSGDGWLNYRIDFHSGDLCNGCSLPIGGCVRDIPEWVPMETARLAIARQAGVEIRMDGDMVCFEPVETTINLIGAKIESDVAWLSPYGGPVLNETMGPNVMPGYLLGHSLDETVTFDLQPIQSSQNWAYEWTDRYARPIDRIDVEPSDIHSYPPPEMNVWVHSSEIPTCTLAMDTIAISATAEIEPGVVITAKQLSRISVWPDENLCNVADLEIAKSTDATEVTPGQDIIYTLTITNHSDTGTGVIFTDTLRPARAIERAWLPNACHWEGDDIACRLVRLGPGASRTLSIRIRVADLYYGEISNVASVAPEGGIDRRFYDNLTAPLVVDVTGGSILILPLVLRGN
jgi:uncharacterized repeat protein (TIGR01451 family)